MSQPQLLAAFQAHVAGLPAADLAPQWLPGHVVDFFISELDEKVHELGGIDAVIKLAQEAYRTYVKPIDLPGVPNLVEPMLDSAAEHLIGVGLRAAHDRIHKG